MPTQKKIDTVEELRERISRASITVGADFTGLRVTEMDQFRRRMRDAQIEVRVIKNNLLKLAADAAQMPDLMEIVTGPTAIVLGYEDATEAAKVISEYAQSAPPTFAIRGAFLDGQVVTADELKTLVSLPPRPVLIAQIAGQLQSPLVVFIGLLESPLRELSLLLQSAVSELPGLIEARVKQLEEQGAPAGGPEPEAPEEAPEEAPAEEPAAAASEEAPAEEPAPEVSEEAPAEEPAPEVSEEAPAEEPAAEASEEEPAAEPETESKPEETAEATAEDESNSEPEPEPAEED
jgi:large subunit ribosomal protein L10